MADPNEAPSPAALREMADEWKQFCRSHEHGETAVTEWMVRGTLMADKLRACADALEAKDREIADEWEACAQLVEDQPAILFVGQSYDGGVKSRAWIARAIRARGKEPKP